MEELIISPFFLAALMFVVSLVYSSVGLGGGSSYTALLAIFGASHRAIPQISLTLNLVVTFMGSINYVREGHLRLKLLLPFLVTSIPMAYLGGTLVLPPRVFYLILLITLILVALRIYLWDEPSLRLNLSERGKLACALVLWAVLGLVAGIVGIGGGIYLVPLIIVLGLGEEKQAAAVGAVFIWVNSAAGLTAHFQRHIPDFVQMAPLIGAVLVGGFAGSYLGATQFGRRTIHRVLGLVILVAIVLLTRRVLI